MNRPRPRTKTRIHPPRLLLLLAALILTLAACTTPEPAATPKVNSVTINQTNQNLEVGDSATLTVSVEAVAGAETTVLWESTNETAVTVTEDGEATALSAGVAEITATSVFDATKSDSVTITATQIATPEVLSVTINAAPENYQVGDTQQLTATVVTAGGAADTVTWSSSKEAVATVSAAGQLTAVAEGTTAITATSTADNTKSGSISISVTMAAAPPEVISVTIDGGDRTEMVGSAVLLTATVGTVRGADESLVWTSSSTTVATIDEDGLLAARSPGVTTITATSVFDTTKSASIQVTVTSRVAGDALWTHQFTGNSSVQIRGMTVDADGNTIVVGYTTNSGRPGNPPRKRDIAVRKVGPNGDELWVRHYGSSEDDEGRGVAVDSEGNIIVVGITEGSLHGEDSSGARDAFALKLDGLGDIIWAHQSGSSWGDYAFTVTADSQDNIIIGGTAGGFFDTQIQATGMGTHGFVMKLASDKTFMWVDYPSSNNRVAVNSVTTDTQGNVIAVGDLFDTLPGQQSSGSADAFIRKYEAAGAILWTDQFGSPMQDSADSVITDSHDNIIITGMYDLGMPPPGFPKVLFRTYAAGGALIESVSFPDEDSDTVGKGVTINSEGNVILVGTTDTDLLDLQRPITGLESFVVQFNGISPDGGHTWGDQISVSGGQWPSVHVFGVATHNDDIIIAGTTNGTLGSSSSGGTDGFIRKYAKPQ